MVSTLNAKTDRVANDRGLLKIRGNRREVELFLRQSGQCQAQGDAGSDEQDGQKERPFLEPGITSQPREKARPLTAPQ